MPIVKVKAPEQASAYDIHIGHGLLKNAATLLASISDRAYHRPFAAAKSNLLRNRVTRCTAVFHTYLEGIACVFFINSNIFPLLRGHGWSRILFVAQGFPLTNAMARRLFPLPDPSAGQPRRALPPPTEKPLRART